MTDRTALADVEGFAATGETYLADDRKHYFDWLLAQTQALRARPD